MSLGLSRDILFILRAKDEVSRTLGQIERSFGGMSGGLARSLDAAGTSALVMGAGLTAVGAAGAGLMAKTTHDFNDYQKQAALTATQMQGIPASLDDIMAATSKLYQVGVPLKELQPALFDIFSSMPVDGLDDATGILGQFAKAAVAGGTDTQTAGRLAIATMNSWGLTSKDLGGILDNQFQLVRLGVGNYEEFATSLGRALPSARRAGADFQQLSGVMAFLTRNGLSTAQASTSAARAFDLLANPKFAANLKNIGIDVADSNGNFRDMGAVVKDVSSKLGGLSESARSKALTDLMFGAGNNIQARRFWDTAILNADQLTNMLDLTSQSAGALDQAYGIMADTGATKTQIFRNRLKLLSIELGERFLPYVLKAMDHVQKWIDKWDALSPKTKDLIAKIVALVAAIGTIGGSSLMIIGMFAKIGAAILGLNPWFVLIAGAAFLIWKNWKTVGPPIMNVLDKIRAAFIWVKDAVLLFISVFQGRFGDPGVLTDKWAIRIVQFAGKVRVAFNNIKEWIVTVFVPAVIKVWNYLWENIPKWVAKAWEIIRTIWAALVKAWDATWNFVKVGIEKIVAAWNWLSQKFTEGVNWFWNTFGPGIMRVWSALAQNIPPLIESIVNFVNTAWDVIQRVAGVVWPIISGIVTTAITVIWDIIQVVLNVITTFWDNWGTHLWDFIKGIWNAITTVIEGAINVVLGIVRLFLDLITGHWSKAWEDLKVILEGAWQIIQGVFSAIWVAIQLIWDTALDILKTAWSTGWDVIKGLAETVWDAITGIFITFWETLKKIFEWVKDTFVAGLAGAWELISGGVEKLWNAVKTPLESLWTILKNIGEIAGGIGEKIGGFIGKLTEFPGFAGGGSYGPGVRIVGEHGPELQFSGSSGYVMNKTRTEQALASIGGGGSGVNIHSGAIQISMGSDIGASQAEAIVARQFDILLGKIKGRR